MKKFACLVLFIYALGNVYGQQGSIRNKKKFIWPEDRPIDTNTVHLNELTTADKSKYPLKITLGYTEQTSCIKNGTLYKVKVVLQNTTNDTLKYLDWTCSHMIWEINNPKLSIYINNHGCGFICNSNYISTFEVPPHKSKETELRIYYEDNVKPTPAKFKVGMIVQRVIKAEDSFRYFQYFSIYRGQLSAQKQNIIWSNEILLEDESNARYYKWILLAFVIIVGAVVIVKRFFKTLNAN